MIGRHRGQVDVALDLREVRRDQQHALRRRPLLQREQPLERA
jgi:hypothetical protein